MSCGRKPWPFLCAHNLLQPCRSQQMTRVASRWNSRCSSGVQLGLCSPRWAFGPRVQAKTWSKARKALKREECGSSAPALSLHIQRLDSSTPGQRLSKLKQQLHGGHTVAGGSSPHSFLHALPENWERARSLQGGPRGPAGGWRGCARWRQLFKLFWSEGSAVLLRGTSISPRRQTCSDICSPWPWENVVIGHPVHGSLWQLVVALRNGPTTLVVLFKKSCFRRKFFYPGKEWKETSEGMKTS